MLERKVEKRFPISWVFLVFFFSLPFINPFIHISLHIYIQWLFIQYLPWASHWWAKANMASELRELGGESDVSQIKTQINVKPSHCNSCKRVIHGDSSWGSSGFLWALMKGWWDIDIFSEVCFSLTFLYLYRLWTTLTYIISLYFHINYAVTRLKKRSLRIIVEKLI